MPFVRKIQTSIGEKYGSLSVITEPFKAAIKTKKPRWHVKCICICGKEVFVTESSLKNKHTTSCRGSKCKTGARPRQIGDKIGSWTVIKEPSYKKTRSGSVQMVTVQCVCKKIRTLQSGSLGRGSNSCGCEMAKLAAVRFTKHGQYNTKLYTAWEGMKQRCFNSKSWAYHRYGGRGIKVCDEWKNSFEGFREWSLGHGYKEGLSIDRVDVDGHYEPSNCEWVTREENSKRQTGNRDKKIKRLENRIKELENQLTNLEWAIDPSIPLPSNEEIDAIPIEDKNKDIKGGIDSKVLKAFPTFIQKD